MGSSGQPVLKHIRGEIDYNAMLGSYTTQLADQEKNLGKDNPFTLETVGEIASIFQMQGNYDKAMEWYERVLVGREMNPGRDDPLTLETVSKIASIYQIQGSYNEAGKLYERVWAGRVRALGEDHPSILETLSNMVAICQIQGKHKEEKRWYQVALAAYKNALRKEHPPTPETISNMASIHQIQGNYGEAEELYRQALVGREKALGMDDLLTLETLSSMALVNQNQGKYQEAVDLYAQVLEHRGKILGRMHPLSLETLDSMASTYIRQGRWREAEVVLERAVGMSKEISKDKLVIDNPRTFKAAANLALTYSGQGRWDEAQTLSMRVMEATEKVLGPEHLDTLTAKANLATIYTNQGNLEEAGSLFAQVAEISEKVFGSEHPATLAAKANLASAYTDQGLQTEAQELFSKVAEVSARVLGKGHPDTVAAMINLESTSSNWEKAEELERKVVERQKGTSGEQNPDTLKSMGNLALIIQKQGRLEEAKELLHQTLEGESALHGPENRSTLISVGRLADIYRQQGTPNCLQAAKELYLRAFHAWQKVDGWNLPTSLHSIETLIQVYHQLGEDVSARELSCSLVRKLSEVEESGGGLCILSRDEEDKMCFRRYFESQKHELENILTPEADDAEENSIAPRANNRAPEGDSRAPRIFCTFKNGCFPSWAVPTLNEAFGFRGGFRISEATSRTELRILPTFWKWAYTNEFRNASDGVDRIARQVDVAQAAVGATLKCSVSHFLPVLEAGQGLSEHSEAKLKEKVFAWVMESAYIPLGPKKQAQTTGNVPNASSPPNSPTKLQHPTGCHGGASEQPDGPAVIDDKAPLTPNSAIRKKYLKLKELFVVDNDMGFPETAADFVIANLESLDKEWAMLIKEGVSFVKTKSDAVVMANGTDVGLVQELLRDANRWSTWKVILNTHIESCKSLTTDLSSDALCQEVELRCEEKGMELWSIKGRMGVITQKMVGHLRRVEEELEKRTERSIQLEFNLSSIRDVHRSTDVAESMKRLSWITFIFLPLVFVASIFGMNVDVISGNKTNPGWWWYLVTSGALMIIVMAVWGASKLFMAEEPMGSLLWLRLPMPQARKWFWKRPTGDIDNMEKGQYTCVAEDSKTGLMAGFKAKKGQKEE